VISGHTPQNTWLPAAEEFPCGQLIGGGPQRKSATWMHARFKPAGAEISVRNLDGRVLHQVDLRPLA
jgi:hypothetical protein